MESSVGKIEYSIISTGSIGNAVVIEKAILIDFGVPYKKIEPYMKDIKLVLATHIHSDHFKASTIRRMALEKPLLKIGCGPFLVEALVNAGVGKGQIVVMQPRMIYECGVCNVIPFPLFHDAPNYGYKLHFPKGKVFYATDTRSLTGITAPKYELYLIENNFREEDLKARMDAKMEAGLYAYEQRVIKNHLSDKRCNDWLYANMGSNSEYVYLHQHIDRGEK